MAYRSAGGPYDEMLEEFGLRLRDSRKRLGLSQLALEEQSGVDQTMISRLERGKAARCPVYRILALEQALGRDFSLAVCPHDHRCVYRPPGVSTLPDRRVWWRRVGD